MKITKTILLMFAILCFSSVCYGDTLNSQSKTSSSLNWKPTSSGAVAAKANQNSAYSSQSIFQDPMLNSVINGYSNMLQGATGNSYNPQEQQKQQLDYTRQYLNGLKQQSVNKEVSAPAPQEYQPGAMHDENNNFDTPW